ncbi:hypothetical protein WAX74_11065 [Psychrobacillus sp. FJAT-51614]|uniref:Uncharacterized protein n=1 Tax=Psychrobacillus mangrovi TaxID=3117745 RepID=A0ABU8F592_9BACI
MSANWSNYVWKLSWLVGLIALILLSSLLGQNIRENSAITFNLIPYFWFITTTFLVFGLYISVLFIRSWTVKLNWPLLLCISLPSLLIAFYSPVIVTVIQYTTSESSNFSAPVPYWIYQINELGIPAIVAGLSIMIGIFENRNTNNSN